MIQHCYFVFVIIIITTLVFTSCHLVNAFSHNISPIAIVRTTRHHHHHHQQQQQLGRYYCFKPKYITVVREEATNLYSSNNNDDINRNRNEIIIKNEYASETDTITPTTTGQKILQLAIPALAALLIDPLLTIADTAFVGRYSNSPAELAGMGVSSSILIFSFYIFNFLCTATTPLVASKRASAPAFNSTDARNDDDVSQASEKEDEAVAISGQALSLALGLGTILSVALIVFSRPLLSLMGVDFPTASATTTSAVATTSEYAMDFLQIRAIAAPAVFTISASTGILRGYLDTKTPIYVLFLANIVNFGLDVILIVFGGLGPKGAAIATTSAEWISAILFLLVLAGKIPSAVTDGSGDDIARIKKKKKKKKKWQQHQRFVLGDTDDRISNKEGNESFDAWEEKMYDDGDDDDYDNEIIPTTAIITPVLSIPPWNDVKPLIVASSAVFIRSLVLQLILTSAAAFATRGSSNDGGDSGTIFISAHQIALQLWLLCSYISDALAAASQGLVADAVGRNDQRNVHDISKTVFSYSAILGMLLGGMLFVGFYSTDFLINLFTSDTRIQTALLEISGLIIISQPLNSVVFAADGVLQGASEFAYQAKSMVLSGVVTVVFFLVFQSYGHSDSLFNVWSALICLQLMRGITSAVKIFDQNGPIQFQVLAHK